MTEVVVAGDFVGHAILSATDQPLGQQKTQEIIKISQSYCDTIGGCHGVDHAERVQQTALYIGAKMAARLDILSAAALLHDIGRREESHSRGKICHAAHGAKIAEQILLDLDFPAADIGAICSCIATHRYRDGNKPASLEARILFDADKLDSIGAIGIGRAFLFAGQFGARLHNRNNNIDNTKPYSLEDTAYREFKVKMSKIKDRMLTPTGTDLARERHAFMEIFFTRLEREITGDGVNNG